MATLLAEAHDAVALNVSQPHVDVVNAKRSPIVDPEITRFLEDQALVLAGDLDVADALDGADFVVVATPTSYDPERDFVDTSSVEKVIGQVAECSPISTVVIKGDYPGWLHLTDADGVPQLEILFSPGFPRKGRALDDNLHPSRTVVADRKALATRQSTLHGWDCHCG